MRRAVVVMLIAAVGGCGGATSTPTTATDVPVSNLSGMLSCAPPAGARVHTVTVPGAASLVAWISNVTPARGATVRAGEFYRIESGSTAPPGFTSVVQTLVADAPNAAGGFASANLGGCGGGSVALAIPRSERPLHLYVRIWIRAGTVAFPDGFRLFSVPADYEASEPLDWIVVP